MNENNSMIRNATLNDLPGVVRMRYIPILVAIIGVIVHALGLLNLIPHPIVILDLSMFLIDTLVVYGLVKKTIWGYWLAVALYLQQSFMQPYWAYQKYIENFYILHPVEYFVAPFLVIVSLIIVVAEKNNREMNV